MMERHKYTVAAKGGAKPFYALIISGDALVMNVAPALAQRLAGNGISTGIIKAIGYFWRRRSPDTMAKDLERQLRLRLAEYPGDDFLLIGFSFGAGTLPFAVNRMDPELRGRIKGVVLLAVMAKADFRFHFRSWFYKSTRRARATAPEITRLSETLPVLYIRGDKDFAGPSVSLASSESLKIITVPGGHSFGKDYDHLYSLIADMFLAGADKSSLS